MRSRLVTWRSGYKDALVFPFAFGVSFWVAAAPLEGAMIIARLLQVFLIVIFALRLRISMRRLRNKKSAVFAVLLPVAAVASILFASRPGSDEYQDLARQIYAAMLIVAVSQVRLTAREEAALFTALGVIAGFALMVCLSAVVAIGGLEVFSSFGHIKSAKYELHAIGLPLNSFAFAISSVVILAFAHYIGTIAGMIFGIAIGVAICALLGSFTSLISLLSASVIAASLHWMSGIPRGARIFVATVAASASTLGVWLVVVLYADQDWLIDLANELTVGRAYLWTVATQEFMRSPLHGAGTMSWKTEMLPAVSAFTSNLATYEQIRGGAYHNVSLTTAAERGVIGICCLLLATAILFLALMNSLRHVHGQVVLPREKVMTIALCIISIFIVVRGVGEYSGYYAYANSQVDLLSLLFVGLAFRQEYRLRSRHYREGS